MAAQLLNIVFKKNDIHCSWGFQVCGGRDSWRPLTVRNVENGTLACNYLNVGDRILEIDGIDCYSLTETQAVSFVRRPSNSVELLVLKRRGDNNVVPPKRSSSCRALRNFTFSIPRRHSVSENDSPPPQPRHLPQQRVPPTDTAACGGIVDPDGYPLSDCARRVARKNDPGPAVSANNGVHCDGGAFQPFSNYRPRRNSLQKDGGEPVCLRSRSSSPQFRKSISVAGPSNDCKNFWRKLEKRSMEDLSVRHTPSPVRPASVAFCPKTPEPVARQKVAAEMVSPKKKVSFSNVLLERNYLQTDLQSDLSPGSRVDEEFNKIYNISRQEDQHQIGATTCTAADLAGDMSASVPPPPQFGAAQGGLSPPPPPPPPPPPMLHSGHIPAIRIKTELNEPREIPSTIQNAMATKDKKPFTYLPGGLDLSEIRSPRMQRRLERNAQTPPSPEHAPQMSPEYDNNNQQQQQQQQPLRAKPMMTDFAQKPAATACNVQQQRPVSADRVCLLPQVQHQPQLNKAPTPWMQKPAQIQPNPAPWTQSSKYVDQVNVDTSKERFVPMRVETNRQVSSSSQPLKNNNTNHSYDSEPIQGRSFKVLQQITEPKSVYDGSQPYNSQSLPLSELRKLQLNDDDRSFMNRVKSQVDDDKFLHNETDPRYRGASIPSRSFRMLQTLTNSAPVPMDNKSVQSTPIHNNNYVSVKPIESKIYVPPSERPVGTEPNKYTGSSIPSRSFRMLQAMTGQNNEREEETRSLTPYPFVCPEFWQYYNYLKEFHDWHIDAIRLHQQQQQRRQRAESVNSEDDDDDDDDAVAYTAHVLNTIDEEEAAEDGKLLKKKAATDGHCNDGSDAECEVTVTVTLPRTTRKETGAAAEVGEVSPVDFWRQINDDDCRTSADNSDDDASGSSEDRATMTAAVDGDRRRSEEDVDSGISATVSADISRQASEKDVGKKYKRTCTHSRLFDILHDDDDDDGGDCSKRRNDDDHRTDRPPPSSSTVTSGYSSAATTPSARAKYESDSGRTDYENYYKSWEYACPYFGYDILPSKAFKAIAAALTGDRDADVAAKPAAVKFKCPKIPADGDDEY